MSYNLLSPSSAELSNQLSIVAGAFGRLWLGENIHLKFWGEIESIWTYKMDSIIEKTD